MDAWTFFVVLSVLVLIIAIIIVIIMEIKEDEKEAQEYNRYLIEKKYKDYIKENLTDDNDEAENDT